jgi:gliding motility-associated-like protein
MNIFKHFILLFFALALSLAANAQVSAGFTASPVSGCAPLVVNFTNTTTPMTGTTFLWTFGSTGTSVFTNPSASFTTPGTHLVTLTATNGGVTSTYTVTITVYPPPVVSFTTSDTSICPGSSVSFSSTSTTGGTPGGMTYSWNFGDGGTSTSSSPSHVYALPGNYSVTLFVTNAQGCTASLTKTAHIHVRNPPVPNFSATPVVICNPPGVVTFSNISSGSGPLTYSWTFGDGGTSTATSPSHTYSSPGSYTVKLVVTDIYGCVDSITRTALVYVGTINAAFTGPASACVFSTVTFTNTSSTHLTRTWDFGDGGTSTALNGVHAYSSPGTYTVTLTIHNGPCSQTITHPITINPGPTVDFTISPVDPCPAPQTITYTGVGPAGVTYNWIYEGGVPGSGSPSSHTYGTNGVKTITMIGTDPITGCKDTVTKTDTLYDLIFHAHATPVEGCAPLFVTFSGEAITYVPSGLPNPYPFPITTWLWDYGDGATPGPTPSHTYTAVGIYTGTVTAWTSNGCPVTDTFRIQVGAPPEVTFTAAPLHVCYGTHTPITFTTTVITGPIDETYWDFGDGGSMVDSPAGPTVVHTFLLPGVFSVTVTPYYRGCPGPPFSITDYITVDSPMAIISSEVQCDPRNRVVFGDSSLGDDTHLWIFGDGFTSTADNPIHDYPALTAYTVTLATYNAASGCRDTQTKVIDLTPAVPSFVADLTSICKYEDVTFTSLVTGSAAATYAWYVDGFPAPVFTATFTDTFYTTGFHTIRLIITDQNGCPDTATRDDYILVGRPVSDFTGSPVSGCLPLIVTFTDASTPATGTTTTGYSWTFGDGGTATVSTTSVPHTYTTAGTFDVVEIVTDNLGCKDTVTKPAFITVYHPTASFSVSNSHPCLNVPVTFTNASTGGVVSSLWDFGDGGTATTTSPVHSYSTTGTFTVKLTVTDGNGCTDQIIFPALINVAKPIANFTMSDSASVCPPLLVNFTNTSTGASSYNWTLGDGGTSTVFSPSNLYVLSGLYNVQLIATSIYGCKDTIEKSVNIFGYAGAFSYSPIQGCVPLAVHFVATLSNVPSITWDFSDGSTSTVSHSDTITHVYSTPGAYVPQLVLSDNTGCQTSSTGIDTIKVDAIYPKFTTEPHPVCIGGEFSFIDSSTSYWTPITSWTWTYDGNTSTLTSPTYTINTPGTYPITLEVVNDWGCIGTITKNVVVDPPPVVTASADTIVCVGDPATLYGYGALTYTWSAPATLSCTACNPTNATPLVITTYTVTGTDHNGCIDSATVTVGLRTHTISNAWGDTAVCAGVPVQLHDTGGHTYVWLPPTGLSSSTVGDPIATPPYTVNYTVIAQLGGCIPDTNYVTLLIYPLPTIDAGPDQRLLAGSTAQIQATGTDIATLKWWPAETLSCPDCFNPVASMSVMTTYNVEAVSDHGCKASDSVTILLYCDNSQVFVPNAFTPNGDGQNDVFYPRGIGVKTIKTFRIYNRWGELLFERTNINLNDAGNAWDGTYKGDTPHPDVYVYIIEAVCYTGEDISIKGDVTIIR